MNTTLATLINSLDFILMSTEKTSENKAAPAAAPTPAEKKIKIPYAKIESGVPLAKEDASLAMNAAGNYGLALWYPALKGGKWTTARTDIHGKVTRTTDVNAKRDMPDGGSIFCTREFQNYQLAIEDTHIVLTAQCTGGKEQHVFQWFLSKTR